MLDEAGNIVGVFSSHLINEKIGSEMDHYYDSGSLGMQLAQINDIVRQVLK
jgi:hypothetical protein